MGLSLAAVLAGAEDGHRVMLIGHRVGSRDPVARDTEVRLVVGIPGPPPAGACVLIAVPDGSVPGVASDLAAAGVTEGPCTALHLSGALVSSALDVLRERGYAIGSLHPLQTVADPASGPERLRGAFFTFEGEPGARGVAGEVVRAAGGYMLDLPPGNKGRYHAACVFASNYLVTCAAVATRLLATAMGLEEREAAQALAPLWRGSIANLERLGARKALTGPVARGDVATVKASLSELTGVDNDLYRQLALGALGLASVDLPAERVAALRDVLEGNGQARE
jgi:predicted short-subunit dehydrogenase-like oxidoreductase (DUF2520 family)